MAFKRFALDDQTSITVYKRRTSRSLRLSITANGEVRVSIPSWAPYASGVSFAAARHDWIKSQQPPVALLIPDQAIGKAHHIRFIASSRSHRPTSRISSSDIRVTHPLEVDHTAPSVQKVAKAASIRALRAQAELLLPQRLADLALSHDYQYCRVAIKRLKSRWGSCDQHGDIVLNLFLMQLPWDCIDYVLVHELVHTKVLRHGPDFWRVMEQELPHVNDLRRIMKTYQPVLHGSLPLAVA